LNISEDSILKAERLSKYFINMAKKIKIQSSEFQTMKTILKEMQGASNKEKTLAVYKINPDFNRTELAELLNVTRRTIINYLKEA
jgi:DNA-binding XRE family transcriptional regulator